MENRFASKITAEIVAVGGTGAEAATIVPGTAEAIPVKEEAENPV
jgi:hypothetical protein